MRVNIHSPLVASLCLLIGCQILQIVCETKVLDMMEDSFDDRYLDCDPGMEDKMDEILKEEMERNEKLKEWWNDANDTWLKKKNSIVHLYPGIKDKYGIAIILYTMAILNPKINPTTPIYKHSPHPIYKHSPDPIYKELNRNTSTFGKSPQDYKDNFKFKALHYYLTRALQELGGDCSSRSQVYRATYFYYSIKSPLVRLGQFASSSLNLAKISRFGYTVFNISTCFGVNISAFSKYPDEEEVLIPMTEIFNVTQINDTWYVLESTGQHCSNFNCTLQTGKKSEDPICRSASGGFPYQNPGNWIFLIGLTVIQLTGFFGMRQ